MCHNRSQTVIKLVRRNVFFSNICVAIYQIGEGKMPVDCILYSLQTQNYYSKIFNDYINIKSSHHAIFLFVSQKACQNTVRTFAGGKITITKECQQAAACENNYEQVS